MAAHLARTSVRQPEPKTPEERREQAQARREWLRHWTRVTAKAEKRVPTLKRTREAMKAEFGFVLANAYINSELQKVRTERGETKLSLSNGDAQGVPTKVIQSIAQLMFKSGILKLHVDGEGHLIDVKIKPSLKPV